MVEATVALARRRVEALEREIAEIRAAPAKRSEYAGEPDWKLFVLEKRLEVARTVLKTAAAKAGGVGAPSER